MKLEDGSVSGMDFQNGRMKGYDSVRNFVLTRQKNRCLLCHKKIRVQDIRPMELHHVVTRKENGSDLPENLIGLCHACHERRHVGKLSSAEERKLKEFGRVKKYAGTSVLNIAMPRIYEELNALVSDLRLCTESNSV